VGDFSSITQTRQEIKHSETKNLFKPQGFISLLLSYFHISYCFGVSRLFWRTPLILIANSWRDGASIEGEQEGEGQPFRGWKGKAFTTCEPRKGHLGRTEAKG
jgi:hypothetical protein